MNRILKRTLYAALGLVNVIYLLIFLALFYVIIDESFIKGAPNMGFFGFGFGLILLITLPLIIALTTTIYGWRKKSIKIICAGTLAPLVYCAGIVMLLDLQE